MGRNPEDECNAVATQHSMGEILTFLISLNICFQINEITYLLYQKLSKFTATDTFPSFLGC